MVLAPERDGPDGALDRIVVEFDAAVFEERERAGQRGRITNGLGEGAGRWKVAELMLRTCRRASAVRPLDQSLDRIEFGDSPQGLGGDR
jgi:hypothetical protein